MAFIQIQRPARQPGFLMKIAARLRGIRAGRAWRAGPGAPAAREGLSGVRAVLPSIPMGYRDGRRTPVSQDACTDLWIRSLR